MTEHLLEFLRLPRQENGPQATVHSLRRSETTARSLRECFSSCCTISLFVRETSCTDTTKLTSQLQQAFRSSQSAPNRKNKYGRNETRRISISAREIPRIIPQPYFLRRFCTSVIRCSLRSWKTGAPPYYCKRIGETSSTTNHYTERSSRQPDRLDSPPRGRSPPPL